MPSDGRRETAYSGVTTPQHQTAQISHVFSHVTLKAAIRSSNQEKRRTLNNRPVQTTSLSSKPTSTSHCGPETSPEPLESPHASASPLLQAPEMAILRHTVAPLRAVRCARKPLGSARSLSMTTRRQGGHGSESQFEPPTGWLWGVKPGEKPEAEGWEWPMYLFGAAFLVTGVALAFKPDTS